MTGVSRFQGSTCVWAKRRLEIANQRFDASSDSERQYMIKSIFIPTHPNALKALLNQLPTATFHHSRPGQNLLLLKLLIVNTSTMALEISLNLQQP
jgi:hypothetical protein